MIIKNVNEFPEKAYSSEFKTHFFFALFIAAHLDFCFSLNVAP